MPTPGNPPSTVVMPERARVRATNHSTFSGLIVECAYRAGLHGGHGSLLHSSSNTSANRLFVGTFTDRHIRRVLDATGGRRSGRARTSRWTRWASSTKPPWRKIRRTMTTAASSGLRNPCRRSKRIRLAGLAVDSKRAPKPRSKTFDAQRMAHELEHRGRSHHVVITSSWMERYGCSSGVPPRHSRLTRPLQPVDKRPAGDQVSICSFPGSTSAHRCATRRRASGEVPSPGAASGCTSPRSWKRRRPWPAVTTSSRRCTARPSGQAKRRIRRGMTSDEPLIRRFGVRIPGGPRDLRSLTRTVR